MEITREQYESRALVLARTIARKTNEQSVRDIAQLKLEQLQEEFDESERRRIEREKKEAELERLRLEQEEKNKKFVKFTARVDKSDYDMIRDTLEESLAMGFDDDYDTNEALLRALMALGMVTYIHDEPTNEV